MRVASYIGKRAHILAATRPLVRCLLLLLLVLSERRFTPSIPCLGHPRFLPHEHKVKQTLRMP